MKRTVSTSKKTAEPNSRPKKKSRTPKKVPDHTPERAAVLQETLDVIMANHGFDLSCTRIKADDILTNLGHAYYYLLKMRVKSYDFTDFYGLRLSLRGEIQTQLNEIIYYYKDEFNHKQSSAELTPMELEIFCLIFFRPDLVWLDAIGWSFEIKAPMLFKFAAALEDFAYSVPPCPDFNQLPRGLEKSEIGNILQIEAFNRYKGTMKDYPSVRANLLMIIAVENLQKTFLKLSLNSMCNGSFNVPRDCFKEKIPNAPVQTGYARGKEYINNSLEKLLEEMAIRDNEETDTEEKEDENENEVGKKYGICNRMHLKDDKFEDIGSPPNSRGRKPKAKPAPEKKLSSVEASDFKLPGIRGAIYEPGPNPRSEIRLPYWGTQLLHKIVSYDYKAPDYQPDTSEYPFKARSPYTFLGKFYDYWLDVNDTAAPFFKAEDLFRPLFNDYMNSIAQNMPGFKAINVDFRLLDRAQYNGPQERTMAECVINRYRSQAKMKEGIIDKVDVFARFEFVSPKNYEEIMIKATKNNKLDIFSMCHGFQKFQNFPEIQIFTDTVHFLIMEPCEKKFEPDTVSGALGLNLALKEFDNRITAYKYLTSKLMNVIHGSESMHRIEEFNEIDYGFIDDIF